MMAHPSARTTIVAACRSRVLAEPAGPVRTGPRKAAGARRASVVDMGSKTAVEVRDNTEERRFEAYVEGSLAGFSTYELNDKGISIMHTEVDDAFEGRGVGSVLVRAALDAVREEGLRVVAECPFVKAYVERHPESVG